VRREIILFDSKALTKIQSIFLIAIIIVAAVGGGVTYVLLSGEGQSSETIKVGVLADLDGFFGKLIWQGTVLAAEQINAEGGLLGRQIEVIGGDSDIESAIGIPDPVIINSALTKLLTVNKVDFIVGLAANQGFMIQELIAQHKKIFFDIGTTEDVYTQRVLEDYDSYKYYFRVTFNATSMFQGLIYFLLYFRELTGLNKIGYLAEDVGWTIGITEGLDVVLPELGFDLVYKRISPRGEVDFSSYFAAAEAAGVEVLVPLIAFQAIPFVKEYHDRQSPMVISSGYLGSSIGSPEGWVNTDGKCEYIVVSSYAVDAGHPLTSKTLPFREEYSGRWSEIPISHAAPAYTILRYIIADAIRRTGTLEVNAVIDALETTSVETPNAKNFVFTPSHDPMMGGDPNDPDAEYAIVMQFQWQNGKLVPIIPEWAMKEAGATYTFPDWLGPWD
jgi:branched-chain amino acid transport system substrate-binding protein